jgi:hypothetical protein
MPRCCSPLLVGRPRTLMNLFNSAQRTYAQWEVALVRFDSMIAASECLNCPKSGKSLR